MLHSRISPLHTTTALSQPGALSQDTSTTNLLQTGLFQAAKRHQALITSPVILLMLAACSSSSNTPVTASPADAGNGDNANNADNGDNGNNGDNGDNGNNGDSGDSGDNTAPAGAALAPTVAEILQEFRVFISVEGDDTFEGDPIVEGDNTAENHRFSAVSYANDPAGVPVDPEDDNATPANVINGVDINLALGQGIDGWDDIDTLANITLVHGSAYDDRLIGGENNNRFFGGDGNDRLTGGGGTNLLNGGAGNDVFVGSEEGINVVTYYTDPAGVFVDLAENTAYDGWDDEDSFVDINHIVGSFYRDIIWDNEFSNNLSGGNGGDLIDGRAGDDTLNGGQGHDVLIGGEGIDFASYVGDIRGVTVNLADGRATDGWGDTDRLSGIENVHGSDHDDMITGNIGDNVLTGGAGDDTLDGGVGLDWVSYQNDTRGVTVNLENGTARDGWRNSDTLIGIENVRGSAHNDTITGDDTMNTLIGGAGDDTIDGGHGIDWISYRYDTNGVTVSLSSEIATDGWGDTDYLDSIENIEGSAYDDRITGNNEVNVLIGLAGDDTIDGGRGNDTIIGGAGSNTLTGGAASDAFVLDIASGDVHTVTDFATTADIIFIDVEDADTANEWTLEEIRTNLELSITSANGNTVISSTGDTHDFEMTLNNVSSLDVLNFEFI